MTEKSSREKVSFSTWLIMLCWLVYTCSYIGKVNYAANINQIMDYYQVSHSEAGLVSTFLFFSYGVGQIVHGVFCKKYNLKWMIFISLMVSGIVNFIIAISDNFAMVKYLWLINGFFMAILWPSLIRLLSETLPKKDMARASVRMGTTVAVGTLVIYGISAIYVSFDMFKLAFYTAGILMPIVAIVWLCLISPLLKKVKEEVKTEDLTEEKQEKVGATSSENGKGKGLMTSICILALFAVMTNLIKDGLTTWVPSILKESYGFDDSLSIILTLLLPIVGVFGNVFAVKVHKKIPDFVSHCTSLFLFSGVLIGGIIGGLSLQQMLITLIGFAIVFFLISSSNSLITSVFPLFMKGKVNSGRIAGILNGFCYLGSTISSYGLGLVADYAGWTAVFWVLLGCCALVCLVWLGYFLSRKLQFRQRKREDS